MKIYAACEVASFPKGLPYPQVDWWRGLIITVYMTGWRISQLRKFRRDNLDLEEGVAVSRARENKGKRDQRVQLHLAIVEHLRRMVSFDPLVFPWPHNKTTLYGEFAKIQEAAGIHLPCDEELEHTRFCHVYGFHDLRRAFATMNADMLSADQLQKMMQHRS